MFKIHQTVKDKLEDQIIRKIPHLDPKDLPKILSIFNSLSKKLQQDQYKRYQIENLLLHTEKNFKDLIDPIGGR